MRPLAAALLLVLAACGKKEPPPSSAPSGTPAYLAWKSGQALRALPAPAFGEYLSLTITVHFPQARSRSATDFLELFVNGVYTGRLTAKPGGAAVAPMSVTVNVPAGAVWMDLWDSTTDRNQREQVDTRQGKDYVFAPTATGYSLTWTSREN